MLIAAAGRPKSRTRNDKDEVQCQSTWVTMRRRWSAGAMEGSTDASQSVRSFAGGHTVRPNRAVRAPSGFRCSDRRAGERTVAGAPGHPRPEGGLELHTREDARDARAVPWPRRVGQVREERRRVDGAGERYRRTRDDGERHARADRREHDARRLAALLRPGRRRRHQSQLRRLSALHIRLRDRRRDCPPAHRYRRPGDRRFTSTSVFKVSSTSAITRRTFRRAWRSSRPNGPTATPTTAATIRRPTSKPTCSARRTRAPP